MAVKIDTLIWDLTIEDKNLDAGFKRAQTKMKNLGKQVVSDLNKIFSDFNIVNNAIRPKKGSGFISAKEAGKKIGEDLLKGLEDKFKTRGTRARELLFRGIINKKEFEKQGRIAGDEFNDGLLATLKGLRARGALTKDLERNLVANLKDTGQAAGRAFGGTFQKTMLQSFFKIQRVLRLAFAGGILSLMTLISRRIIATFRRTARVVSEVLTKAGDFARVQRAFQFLTTSVGIAPESLLRKARAASVGLVSDLELIKQLNFALQASLPVTEDQLASLAFAARRLGESVGRDATEAFQRLVNAIVKQERRVLDELGIVVRFQKAHKEWAAAMGITGRALTTQETILANLEVVQKAALETVFRLGGEVDDVGKKFQRMKTNVENAKLEFLDIVNKSGAVLSILERLGGGAKSFGDAIVNNSVKIRTELDLILIKIELVARKFAGIIRFLNSDFGKGISGAISAGGFPVPPEIKNLFKADFGSIGETEGSARATVEAANAEAARTDALVESLIASDNLKQIEAVRFNLAVRAARVAKEETDNLVDQTAQAARLLAFEQGALNLASRANILRAKAVEDEEAADKPSDAEQKRIDTARKRLRLLEDEIALLQTFGATTLAGISAAPLKAIASEILQINEQIRTTEELLKTAQIGSEEAEARLKDLQDRRDELGRQKGRFDANPELLISEAAKTATRDVERLVEARRLLAAFGVEFIADLPPQAAEIADKLNSVGESIRSLLAQQDAAVKEGKLDLALALGIEVGILKRQQGELKKLAANLQLVGIVLKDFPDIKARFFAGLDPETLIKLSRLLREVAAGSKELADAREALAVANKKGNEDKIGAAQERLATAIESNIQKNTELEAVLITLGLTEEQRAVVLALINDLLAEQDDKTSDLLKSLRGLRSAVRGVLALADAFGILDRQSRLVLAGIDNILGGVLQLGQGLETNNPFQIFGGIVQGIGGIARIFSGLFSGQPDPGTERLREQSEKTADALRDLAASADKLDSALSGLTGRQLLTNFDNLAANVDRIIAERFDPADLDPGERFDPDEIAAFRLAATAQALQDMGITLADLEAIAEATGVDLSAITALYLGQATSLKEVEAAIQNATIALDILAERAFRSFSTQLDLLATKFDIFDDVFEKPLDRLQALVDVLSDPELGFLPEDIAEQFKSFDLTTPEGRAGLDAFIRELFTRFAAGDFSVLGGLTPLEFLEALSKSEELLDEIAENTAAGADGETESAIIRKSITEVTGNRMVGVLTTIAIINQGILALAKAILLEIGGTVPTDIQAITFRSPAIQLDILEIEQQQLNVLVEIRDILGESGFAGPAPAPVSVEDIPFNPTTTKDLNGPRLTANVTIENPQFNADINTTGGVTVEDAREFARQAGVFLVEEVDVALGKSVFRRTTRNTR